MPLSRLEITSELVHPQAAFSLDLAQCIERPRTLDQRMGEAVQALDGAVDPLDDRCVGDEEFLQGLEVSMASW